MELPASTAINSALLRQNMTMSVIKSNAEQGEMVAKILEESIRSTPISTARGTNINYSI